MIGKYTNWKPIRSDLIVARASVGRMHERLMFRSPANLDVEIPKGAKVVQLKHANQVPMLGHPRPSPPKATLRGIIFGVPERVQSQIHGSRGGTMMGDGMVTVLVSIESWGVLALHRCVMVV